VAGSLRPYAGGGGSRTAVTETRLHRARHVVVGASKWYYGDYPWGLAKDSLVASLLLLLIGTASALGLIALGVGLFVVRPAPPAGPP